LKPSTLMLHENPIDEYSCSFARLTYSADLKHPRRQWHIRVNRMAVGFIQKANERVGGFFPSARRKLQELFLLVKNS
jgi:hypothetical protein